MRSATLLFFAFVTFCLGVIASSFSSILTAFFSPTPGQIPSAEPWRTYIFGATFALVVVFLLLAIGFLFVQPPDQDE